MKENNCFNTPKYEIESTRILAKDYAGYCRAIIETYTKEEFDHFPEYELDPDGYNDLRLSRTMQIRFINDTRNINTPDFIKDCEEKEISIEDYEEEIYKINGKILIRKIHIRKSERNLAKRRRFIKRITDDAIEGYRLSVVRKNNGSLKNFDRKIENSIRIFGTICCDYYLRCPEKYITYCRLKALEQKYRNLFEEINFNKLRHEIKK